MYKFKLLFVCLGNVCRSPLAEAIFEDYICQKNLVDSFICDSAGTSHFHVGESPDERAYMAAQEFGIKLQHTAKQFIATDLDNYDYILVMDHMNYDDVMCYAKNNTHKQKILLWRSFDSQVNDVYDIPDPYYGSDIDFIEVIDIFKRSSIGFVEFLGKGVE